MARTTTKTSPQAQAPQEARTRRAIIEPSAIIAGATGASEPVNEERVTVLIPKSFTLTLSDHKPIPYEAGIAEMPLSHLDHWYSKGMGVEAYQPEKRQLGD